jgi:hypothetical protein
VLIGPIILAVILVVVLPVVFLLTGLIVAAIYGLLLPDAVEAEHEDSELIPLNQ